MNCVKVYIKHRPGRESEKFVIDDNTVIYQGKDKDPNMNNGKEITPATSTEYQFDKVIQPPSKAYDELDIQHHALIFCEGRSSAVFTYGYSNSGKTHTWFNEQQGIIWPLLDDIMRHKSVDCHIKISICELYNDKLRNLCSKSDVPLTIFNGRIMQIVEDAKGKKPSINVLVNDASDFKFKINEALKKRQVASTHLNDVSSRSHLIINIYLCKTAKDGSDIYISRLALLDCAGNERLGSSQIAKKQTKEAGSINNNLFELKRCIRFLSRRDNNNDDKNGTKFAFRGSKLTLPLKGVDYMSIIACVDFLNENDSKNTLDFVVTGKSVILDQTSNNRESKVSVRNSLTNTTNKEPMSFRKPILNTPKTIPISPVVVDDQMSRMVDQINKYMDKHDGPNDLDPISALKWIRKDRKIRDDIYKEEQDERLTVLENVNEMLGSRTDCMDYLYNNIYKHFNELQQETGDFDSDLGQMMKQVFDANVQLKKDKMEMGKALEKLQKENTRLLEEQKNSQLFNKIENRRILGEVGNFTLKPNENNKNHKRKNINNENEYPIVEISDIKRETRSRSKRVRLQR